MTRPRRSTRITRLHSYHGAVRPCAPHRYSAPHRICCLGFSRARPDRRPTLAPLADPHRRGDRFPRSVQDPDLSSRHLHAGRRLGSQQAPPRLIPRYDLNLGFDVNQKLSTRHQWFTRVRLLRSHLTRSRRAVSATLTTPALDRRSLRWFAASPCRATTEGHTSISCTAPPSPTQPLPQVTSDVRGHTGRGFF